MGARALSSCVCFLVLLPRGRGTQCESGLLREAPLQLPLHCDAGTQCCAPLSPRIAVP